MRHIECRRLPLFPTVILLNGVNTTELLYYDYTDRTSSVATTGTIGWW